MRFSRRAKQTDDETKHNTNNNEIKTVNHEIQHTAIIAQVIKRQ
jgi:hypothetical protein